MQRIRDRKSCDRAPAKQRASSLTPSHGWRTRSLMKPLTFLFFPRHHTEDPFNSFGHWGIAKVAAKLSSQSSSICGKTLPLQLSLCQLPWAEEEEEDDSEEVVMKGFIGCSAGLDFTACSSGLFKTSATSSGTQDYSSLGKANVLFPSHYLLLSLLLWWVLPPAQALPPLLVWNPECREKAEPKPYSWDRSTKTGFSHHGIKPLIKSHLSCNKFWKSAALLDA